MKRNEESLQDNIKPNDIHIIEIIEGKERKEQNAYLKK